jgi:hypothetical protein
MSSLAKRTEYNASSAWSLNLRLVVFGVGCQCRGPIENVWCLVTPPSHILPSSRPQCPGVLYSKTIARSCFRSSVVAGVFDLAGPEHRGQDICSVVVAAGFNCVQVCRLAACTDNNPPELLSYLIFPFHGLALCHTAVPVVDQIWVLYPNMSSLKSFITLTPWEIGTRLVSLAPETQTISPNS